MNIVSLLVDQRRRKKEWKEHEGDDRTAFVLAKLEEVTDRADRMAGEVAEAAQQRGARIAR